MRYGKRKAVVPATGKTVHYKVQLCVANTKSGRRCHSTVMPGTALCRFHTPGFKHWRQSNGQMPMTTSINKLHLVLRELVTEMVGPAVKQAMRKLLS